MNTTSIIHIVPPGLFSKLYFAFYQYLVPTGQSQRNWISEEQLLPLWSKSRRDEIFFCLGFVNFVCFFNLN